jgi:large subunit ribosomal protein L10
MTKAEKTATIEALVEQLKDQNFFYITDASGLSVEQTNKLRRICFEQGIELRVIKNTLIKNALERIEGRDYSDLYQALHGPTAVMFSDQSSLPARIIKEFRETNAKPVLKAAYIDTDVYVGDDQIEALTKLKTKNELLGELIGLLQSPMQNLLGALQSGGQTIAGVLKTLEEREG